MRCVALAGIVLALAAGCAGAVEKAADSRTAEGVLRHFPSGVKSVQAWYGHTYFVGDVPVLPSDRVPEEQLKTRVGRNVRVAGPWNPGRERKLTAMEQMPSDEVGKESVIAGDGIMVEEIADLPK